MNNSTLTREFGQKLILVAVFLIPLAISPGITLDPTNIAKLVGLSTIGFACLFLVIPFLIDSVPTLKLLVAIIIFALAFLIPFFFSGADYVSQFYGSYGRNNGILSWLSLALLGTAAYFFNEKYFYKSFLGVFCLSGFVVAVFGLLQWFGWDPIKWRSFYSGSFSTLGNPNFFGAFCGILFTISITASLGKKENSKKSQIINSPSFFRICAVLAVLGALSSNSLQGLALVVFGLCSTTVLIAGKNRGLTRVFLYSYLLFLLISLLAWIFMRLFLPTVALESEQSISQRFSFWIAGIMMIRNNAYTGVGFDNYGDWYRFYRSDDLNTFSNSAHNLFLDVGASSGILGLSIVCVVSIWITAKANRASTYNSDSKLDSKKIALTLGWHAFLLQSLISVGHLGLIVIGGLLGAVAASHGETGQRNELIKSRSFSPVYRLILGLILGSLLVAPLVKKERDFLMAKEGNDVEKFISSIYSFPQLPYYFQAGSMILEGAGYWGKASFIAIDGITQFPDNLQLRVAVAERGLRSLDSTFLKNNQLEIERLNPDN